MTAAPGARIGWARRRLGGQAGSSVPGRNIARVTTFLLLMFALAVVACAAAGLSATQRYEAWQAAERHQGLEAALGELSRGLRRCRSLRPRRAQPHRAPCRARRPAIRHRSDLRRQPRGAVASRRTGPHRRLVQLDARPRACTYHEPAVDHRRRRWNPARARRGYPAFGATQRLASVARPQSATRCASSPRRTPLTGLPNRRVMLARLDDMTAARDAVRRFGCCSISTASATSTTCSAGPAATPCW